MEFCVKNCQTPGPPFICPKVAWIVHAILTFSEFVRRKYLSLFHSVELLQLWHSLCCSYNDGIRRIWHWIKLGGVAKSRHLHSFLRSFLGEIFKRFLCFYGCKDIVLLLKGAQLLFFLPLNFNSCGFSPLWPKGQGEVPRSPKWLSVRKKASHSSEISCFVNQAALKTGCGA